MKFKDIPQFTCDGNYAVNVSWSYLEEQLNHYKKDFNLQLDPDFQRPHVWTLEKQERYVEFMLRGGKSSRDIYFNQPNWMHWKEDENLKNPLVLVDGKQRLNAARLFLNNDIKVFGHYYKEFEDSLHTTVDFIFHVNDLPTRKEVLQWYLDLNSGGVVHTEKELDHVRKLLSKETDIIASYNKGIKRKAIKIKLNFMLFNLIIIVHMLDVLINDKVLINTCSIKYFKYKKCLNNIFISNVYYAVNYVVLVIRILVYNKHQPSSTLDKPP